jgi:signal transduction histidine kinase
MPTRPGAGVSPVLRGLLLGQHALVAVLLVVGAVRATSDSPAAPAVLGAAALALWYAGGAWLARRRGDRLAGALWLGVLLAGWLGLVLLSPDFSWLAFPLFFLCLHLLPTRPGLVVVAAMTAVVVVVQLATPSGNRVAQVLGPCLGAVVAVGMSTAYRRLVAENRERHRLVTELLAAQEDLVATHDALASAQRQAGALAERARLARDIHDTLAQGFSSILLLARAGLAEQDAAGRRAAPLSGDPVGGPDAVLPRQIGLLRQIETTASENLDEARRVVHALAPAVLGEAPLLGALQRLLARTGEQAEIATALRCDGDPVVLPTRVEVALLRFAQGALANVRQHAEATLVALSLTYGDTEVRLDVVDDGVGFDPALAVEPSEEGAGFGLRAMRDRLAELGGSLDVESAPGDGTALAATVPRTDPSSPAGAR